MIFCYYLLYHDTAVPAVCGLNTVLLKRGELTSSDEVVRGKTNLACLYCGGGLTAKKGSVKEHYFAHTGETCCACVAAD